jgi:hypothetical protein
MGLFDDLIPSQSAGPPAAPSLDPRSRELAIRTVLGEAANEPPDGQAGVAAVIRNRMQAGRYGGTDVPRVVTAPSQFEPWGTEAGRQRMFGYSPDSEPYKNAAAAVDRVFGEGYDPTNGATHFYSPTAQAALGRQPPQWAQGQEPQNIGRHAFYAPEGRVASTDVSSQARRPGGLFDDLIPAAPPATSSQPPETGPPADATSADTGGRFTDNPGQNFRTAREGQSPSMGRLEAFVTALGHGASANWIDEIAGLHEAGIAGLPKTAQAAAPPIASHLMGLARLGYETLTGEPGAATEAYKETSEQERDRMERAKAQYPGTALAGQITGAMAVPGGAAARGATLGVRAVQGAKVGGLMGAISGAGEGTDLASRATGAVTGGATGTVLGAVAAPVVEGVVKAGQAVSRAASPIVQAIRGVRDPEAEAARRVTGALQRDAQTGSAGMTPAEFAAERAAGTPVAIGDMGGTATKGLARSAANTSSEGRAALEAVTSDRYATQNPRTAQWLKETFDFPDAGAKLDQIQEAARRANAPAYRQAYKEGSKGIWDDGLEQFSQAPVMQDAIRSAFLTARNRAAVEGVPPVQNPFVLNKATGVFELQTAADGSRALPNLQFWDHVKRNLDAVNSPESRAAAQALRDHLDQIVPSYKTARQGAANWFGAEDTLDAGAKFATMSGLDSIKLSQARAQIAKMSEPDRKLFETGFVSNLIAKVENLKDGQDIVKNIFNSEMARKQIESAIGKDKAGQLEARLQTERVMNGLKDALGNSTTARQLYELGMAGATNPYTLAGAAGGISAYGSGNVGPGDAFAAGLVFAARKGQIKIDERIARHVGEMLASDDAGVLKKGMAIVARNDSLKRALRLFDLPTARVSSQQAPSALPQIQGPITGRAEGDQQN